MEYERLPDVFAAIDEVEPLRAAPLSAHVLLSRTVSQASSTQTFRELITDSGHQVLECTIPCREVIAQSFGSKIATPSTYSVAVEEILKLRKKK